VDTDGLELKAMVPVSVRSEEARGALGNQVAAMMAPLPVGLQDPVARMERISASMAHLKSGGQAVGAQVLTELTGFAPPNIMSQAARVVARQRMFNLVVTNVPGPQFPLYMLGRELEGLFPMVPLAPNQALGIAIMSYNGTINFGLVGDFDLMSDLEDLSRDLLASLGELGEAAGVSLSLPRKASRGRGTGTNGHKPGRKIGTSTVTASGSSDK
jgi:WS/DGAT/MGAT family acyltransferase